MKIYIAHSREFDFRKELYEPIRKSELNELAEIILPHEESEELFKSKEELKTVDYMVAEVSYPSTGVGIELGWANLYGTKIIALHKSGTKVSSAIKAVTDTLIEYSDSSDLIAKIMVFCKISKTI